MGAKPSHAVVLGNTYIRRGSEGQKEGFQETEPGPRKKKENQMGG